MANLSTYLKLCPECDEPRLSNADDVLHCTNCGWSEEDEVDFSGLNGDTSEPIPSGALADMLEELEHEEQP